MQQQALAMQILIAVTTAPRLHGNHPEGVGISAEEVNGLPEPQLNLEPIAVELEYLQRCE